MRIDYDTHRNAISCAEDYVGSLTGRAGNGEHLFHGLRDLAAEFLNHFLRGAHNRFRLVIEEAGAADVVRQDFRTHRGEIARCRIFGEQAGRNQIHAFVGALRGKNRGYQQLPGIAMLESADSIGIHLVQTGQNAVYARAALSGGFRALRLRGQGGYGDVIWTSGETFCQSGSS